MDLIAVLITGLVAGGISCAAVQGGLLAGLIARQQAARSVVAAESKALVPQTGGPSSGEVAGDVQTWRSKLGDDLAPVGAFLAGKLVSHTVLGAALGALGGAVQLSLGLRTWLHIAAGLLIIAFGLAQLGVPGFRRIVVQPPASWARLVHNRTRSQAAFAPALLGLAMVLLPCGVTLSVEALAMVSGSPWRGAAIMAVFVAGTSPLFAILGYAARKAAAVWHGRLVAATGVLIVATGLLALNSGLELAGSPLAASRLLQTMGTSTEHENTRLADGRQEVVVTATNGGYSPRDSKISAGIPTTLIVRANGVTGCARTFVFGGRETLLPQSGDTRIDLSIPTSGTLWFACGMGMYTGTITVTET